MDDTDSLMEEIAKNRIKLREQTQGKPVTEDLLDYLKNRDQYSGFIDEFYPQEGAPPDGVAKGIKEYLTDPTRYEGFSFNRDAGESADTLHPADKEALVKTLEQARLQDQQMQMMERQPRMGNQGPETYSSLENNEEEPIDLQQDQPHSSIDKLTQEIARNRLAQKAGAPYTIEAKYGPDVGKKKSVSIRQVYR